MSKKVHLSARLNPQTATWIRTTAKKLNCTQAEILEKAVSDIQQINAKQLATQVTTKATKMAKNGVVPEEDDKVLQQLGISTLSGVAGYYISGYIREQMELDEDKGTQLLIGLVVGLGTQILQTFYSEQKK